MEKCSPLRNGMEGFPGPTSSPTQHWPCASSPGLEIEAVCPMGFCQVPRWPVGPERTDQGPGLKPGFFLLSEVISATKNISILTVDLSDLYLRIPGGSLNISPSNPGDCYEKISDRRAAASPLWMPSKDRGHGFYRVSKSWLCARWAQEQKVGGDSGAKLKVNRQPLGCTI